MTDFYIRNAMVWVRVVRGRNGAFSFGIGYKGDLFAFKTSIYPKEFMPTIADARALAKTIAEDYI